MVISFSLAELLLPLILEVCHLKWRWFLVQNMNSVLFESMQTLIPSASCSRFCSRDSARVIVFVRSTRLSVCYIKYAMDFRFVPSDPVCFDKLSRCD